MADDPKAEVLRGAKSDPTLLPLEGPELVFALVGPVGTDLSLLSDVLREELASVKYTSDVVRLSDLLREIPQFQNLPIAPADLRWEEHMTAGTKFRNDLERGDALALLAISHIRETRKAKPGGNENEPLKNHAFVLHSLKHPDEIVTLRKIYGNALFVISAYSSRPARINSISDKIARTRNDSDKSKFRDKAERLVRRDEEELETRLGQDVKDAFPLGDVFVQCELRSEIRLQLSRFIDTLFGHPFHTPTRDEYGMFSAKAAAVRSSDLGRQVGAAILNKEGDLIAASCNDVPKAGGGLYWPGDFDYRDFQIGYDTNARVRKDLISEILDRLNEAAFLKPAEEGETVNIPDLVDKVLAGGQKPLLKGARIMGLLEFGRTVHAEMAALMDAARRGVSVSECTLFTTTFPCHLCARHIVAAGIKRVVYIEPYPKSMVAELYPDSVAVDAVSQRASCVPFEPFTGVAPRRYLQFFEAIERKESDGSIRRWSRVKAHPRIERILNTYLLLELDAVHLLKGAMTTKGLRGTESAAKSN